jgi:hypothetical protein
VCQAPAGDLPTRLSTRALAIALPITGEDGLAVSARLEVLCSHLAGRPVTAGLAFFPQVGPAAAELLRVATRRSLILQPVRQQDPELEWLLGPLAEAPHLDERRSVPGRKEIAQGR